MTDRCRHELVAELLHAANVLGQAGCLPATDGNFSARLNDEIVLLTARGVEKQNLLEADIFDVLLDDEQTVRGSTEWPMHRTLYRGRSDVNCVLHAHSPGLTAFAAAHRVPKTEILAEASMTVGTIALVPFVKPGTLQLGETLLQTCSTAGVYLLSNHGAVAVGGSVREALHRLERAEFLARVELNASALGGARLLTPVQIANLR